MVIAKGTGVLWGVNSSFNESCRAQKRKGVSSCPHKVYEAKNWWCDHQSYTWYVSWWWIHPHNAWKKGHVKVNGISHQKRLILCKLEELYRLFKEQNPAMKVSLSKFCQERPKWCILVGPKGTHSVCTCIQHENAKLLASNTDFDYKVHNLNYFENHWDLINYHD